MLILIEGMEPGYLPDTHDYLIDLICSTEDLDVRVLDNLALLFLCVIESISLKSVHYDFISLFQIFWTRASTYGMVFKESRL